MSSLHHNSRTARLAAAPRTFTLLAVLGMAILCTSPALATEILSEEHLFDSKVYSPRWDSVNDYTLDLPQFDTAGGTRTLIGYDVNCYLDALYTYSIAANPTADVVGCETHWDMTWHANLNGALWFPLDQPSGNLTLGQGRGEIRAPYSAAEPPVQSFGGGVEITRSFDDPALLAQLTGTGTATLACTYTLSNRAVFEPTRWPGAPGVFNPNLIDLAMDELLARVTVTYYWTPEPNSLLLMGLGVLTFLHRR